MSDDRLIIGNDPDGFQITLERLESVIAKLALADPTRIVALRVSACRYCHGKDHQYQWRTKREFQERKVYVERCIDFVATGVMKAANADDLILPSAKGGYGYSRLLAPNQKCPECDGLGEQWVWAADHTTLRPHERALLNGVKQDKNGRITVEIEKKSTYLKALTDLLRLHFHTDDEIAKDRISEILELAIPKYD